MAVGAIARLLIKGGQYALKKYWKKAATKSKNKIKEVSLKKRKSLKKIKPVKSASPIKEVKKAKKSLQNQKVDKSPKTSDWDAHVYNQKHRIGHGKSIGPRATATLERKYPKISTRKGTHGTTAKYYKDKSDVVQAPKIKEVKVSKKSSKNQAKYHSEPVHPGLGGKMTAKKPHDASLKRAINEWKNKKGKK